MKGNSDHNEKPLDNVIEDPVHMSVDQNLLERDYI